MKRLITQANVAKKEYQTRNNLVGGVIHRELCQRLKFDHTNKWYMHKPESVQEDETHEIICDSEGVFLSLIDRISIFMGYLMLKLSFWKDSNGAI